MAQDTDSENLGLEFLKLADKKKWLRNPVQRSKRDLNLDTRKRGLV